MKEKNLALLKGGMAADKPEAEHPDGRGGDRVRTAITKRTRVAAMKPKPRPGKKRSPR